METTERRIDRYEAVPPRSLRFGRSPGCGAVFAGLLAVAGLCAEAQQNGGTTQPSLSLTLPKAVEMAMQHNRHLRLAQLSVEESKTKQTIAKSNYFPHISNQSTALYFTELQGVVIPAGAFGHSAPDRSDPGRGAHIRTGSA